VTTNRNTGSDGGGGSVSGAPDLGRVVHVLRERIKTMEVTMLASKVSLIQDLCAVEHFILLVFSYGALFLLISSLLCVFRCTWKTQ
jgi:hypothetical protein